MKVLVEKNYKEMSKKAADILVEEINKDRSITLGLATGSTPEGVYKNLIKAYNNKELDFSKVQTFNLDEYVGLEDSHPKSYRYFMNEKLFDHVNIDKTKTHVPDGKAKDLTAYTKAYDKLIEESGGIDIQVLGIGTNGHIAFNEPADELSVGTSVVHLTQNTISDNSRFFDTLEEVPKTAITMGIGSILKARKIILLASGKNKSKVINDLLNRKTVSTQLPASFLLLHPDVTVIVDEDAYKGGENDEDSI